jgi:hypothetical protein
MAKTDFRPGRIQTLAPEQEIVFKQVWGYLLRYWGYDLNIPVADLAFQDAFVSSSINCRNEAVVDEAVLVANGATHSVQQQPRKKSWGSLLKGGGGGSSDDAATGRASETDASKLKRIQRVRSKKEERYKPLNISDQHRFAYAHHYDQGSEFSREYELDQLTPSSFSSMADLVETAITNLTLDDNTKVDHSAPVGHDGNSGLRKPDGTEVVCKAKTAILPLFANYKPEELHGAFWKNQRQDLLDNWVLKFVRARNFDVERSLAMFTRDLDWRTNECRAYEWLLEGDAPLYIKGTNQGFVKNFLVNKAWIRGRDKKENIVFLFRAKMHMIADANPSDEMRRWCVTMIEWCRLFMSDAKSLKDQANILFDLTGFSLKNADYTTIKFIADVFEAHYPECLEKIFIYNAPWIFSTFWNIIKVWLDPVVASKIVFVKDINEIGEYIDVAQLPRFMDGKDDFEGEYPTPTKSDATIEPRDSRYIQLIRERDEYNLQFLDRTARWIESYDQKMSSRYLEEKINISMKLAKNFVELDPYIRRRGVPDRVSASPLTLVAD